MQYPPGVLIDEPGEVPFGVRAWVALRAHELSQKRSGVTAPDDASWLAHNAGTRDNLLYSLKAQFTSLVVVRYGHFTPFG